MDGLSRAHLAAEFLDAASGYSAAANYFRQVRSSAHGLEETLRAQNRNPRRSSRWRLEHATRLGAEMVFTYIVTGWMIDNDHDPDAAAVFELTEEILRLARG
jgi:hypothetical protein